MRNEQYWQRVAVRLAQILHMNVEVGKRDESPTSLKHSADRSFFPVGHDWGLWVEGSISVREQQLLTMLIEKQNGEKRLAPKERLIHWLRDVERSQRVQAEPPEWDELTLTERVPFYVVSHGAPLRESEVSRVLQPFFDGQVWVLAVSAHEYFILPLAALVYEEDEIEGWQETLWHWAEGLVELFASELGEDVQTVVHPPVETAGELGSAWLEIKHTFSLGRALHPQRNVFATWDMALERLLHVLPREDCRTFLEEVASESHSWWSDLEMRDTLETFFRLNLNVSETARQLFVHRNTLLYRLDKLKQETGRDVRQFEDAMLIRLALLLTADTI